MTKITRPPAHSGIRHLALRVCNFDAMKHFYIELMGMQVEWHPDADNLYLSSGNDNLALHRAAETLENGNNQSLDHLGFILASEELVHQWFKFLTEHKVEMRTSPRTHRDGACSFYCYDPDGNTVQMIYHPPIA